MSNPRLPIAKLRQIIQFKSSKLSAREVGRALSLSHGAARSTDARCVPPE
jgi:hypothetical protein